MQTSVSRRRTFAREVGDAANKKCAGLERPAPPRQNNGGRGQRARLLVAVGPAGAAASPLPLRAGSGGAAEAAPGAFHSAQIRTRRQFKQRSAAAQRRSGAATQRRSGAASQQRDDERTRLVRRDEQRGTRVHSRDNQPETHDSYTKRSRAAVEGSAWGKPICLTWLDEHHSPFLPSICSQCRTYHTGAASSGSKFYIVCTCGSQLAVKVV